MEPLGPTGRDVLRDLLRRQVEAQVGRADTGLITLALALVDDALEISSDTSYLPASHWHGTYWVRAGRWARHGVHVPGLAETLVAFSNATSDLRSVCLPGPPWVGILWFGTDGNLVGAIDLRGLATDP